MNTYNQNEVVCITRATQSITPENQMDIATAIPIVSRKKARRIYPNEVLAHYKSWLQSL